MTFLSGRARAAIVSAAILSLPALASAAASAAPPAPDPSAHLTTVDADQNFRGLDAVSRTEAWISGESLSGGAGKVFHTTDGGRSWLDVTPPGTDGLSLRDVEVTPKAVHVLAIGPGEDSRIFRTTDDGATWTEAFRNPDPAAFYDCMDFYPGGRVGLAVSDPVGGKLRILRTTDAGVTWSVLPSAGMPASDNEFGFAASGNCLVTAGRSAYLITGGSQSRAIRSDDLGLTWTATETGIPAGEAAGGFAGDFGTPRRGIAVGGDFADPSDTTDSAAYTRDGRTWRLGEDLTHVGEDVAMVRGWKVAIASGNYGGSTGTSLTTDGGATWTRLSDVGFHALDCEAGVCWGAGRGVAGRS